MDLQIEIKQNELKLTKYQNALTKRQSAKLEQVQKMATMESGITEKRIYENYR